MQARKLVGVYYFAWAEPWLAFVFHCEIESGQPIIPLTGEIAEVGWFHPQDWPSPLTNTAPFAIADVVSGEYGVVRDIAPQ